MNAFSKKARVTLAVIGALGLGALGTTAAMAATPTPTPSQVSSVTSTDAPGAIETPDAAETSTGVEAPEASDGNDGGHADPEGVDVNNVGGTAEK